MVSNVNEPVFTTGSILHAGGGDDALIVVPTDLDALDIALDVAAATTAQVESTVDSYEDILGITERLLRYGQAAINDLGGSGELRLNAGAAQDFTDDGWAVGDTFEAISHKAPDFGPEGTQPPTTADKEVYTVTSVAAKVLGFSEDPGFSLSEGDIVVAQSRAAVAEASLNWVQIGADVVGPSIEQITVPEGRAVRVIASAGAGDITYTVSGTRQSKVRPAPFVAKVEERKYGVQADAVGTLLIADAAPVWSRVFEGGEMRAQMVVSGFDFGAANVVQFDRIFVSRFSATGNGGVHSVKVVASDTLTFYEPLRGSEGTDDARVTLYRHIAT